MKTYPSKNIGFSLLEILISLVIMSVGMVGLAGLKIVAIKGENESHFRHEASLLMMELADRIRANSAGVDAGSYEAHGSISVTTAPSVLCDEGSCSASQLATFDMYSVAKKISVAVPGSSVSITCPSNDCSTISAIEEDNSDPANPIAAAAEIKKIHTVLITWKVKKQKEEDGAMGSDVDEQSHVRSIQMDVDP